MKMKRYPKNSRNEVGLFWIIQGIIILGMIVVSIIVFKYIRIKNNTAIISFMGAYLGGILTYLGVILTMHHTERLNKASEKKQHNAILEEKRLDNLPYIGVEFRAIDPQQSNGFQPLVHDILSDKLIFKALIMNNYGLGGAFDLFFHVYDKETDPNCFNSKENVLFPQRGHISIPVDIPSNIEGKDLLLVIFFKDIIGNQYAQEILLCLMGEDVIIQETFLPRIITFECAYELPIWFGIDEKLSKYELENFSDYERGKLPELESNHEFELMEEFNEKILELAKKEFALPTMKCRRGDLYLYRKMGERMYRLAFFQESGSSVEQIMDYYIITNINLQTGEEHLVDCKICINGLSNNTTLKKKFEKKLKNTLKNFNNQSM